MRFESLEGNRTTALWIRVFDLEGANALLGVVQGSVDEANWFDLTICGPVDDATGKGCVVQDPPEFLRVVLTADAPALWNGHILASVELPPLPPAEKLPTQQSSTIRVFIGSFIQRHALSIDILPHGPSSSPLTA